MKRTDPFYASASWRRVRAIALQRDGGFCQDCLDRFRAGTITRPHRAHMVHHIQPISEHPELSLELDNLRSLCDECHAKRHPEKGSDRKADQDLMTVTNRIRVIKV